ncbi:hypothetical protein [Paraglaciecola sp. L3A3]|uniref:hypothetical protein n=1 Tax=Paraglaciecola sp. L3A3 TaxID=2686358 RepID=UPI00131E295A|nr:hypothetical protein [Paraglaciecola sp. L3A3]
MHNARKAKVGESINISFEIEKKAAGVAALMVVFKVHFVKANGSANPKVFKLKAIELAANQTQCFQ